MKVTFDLNGKDSNLYVLIGKAKNAIEAVADEDAGSAYASQATAYNDYDEVVILTIETLEQFGIEHNL